MHIRQAIRDLAEPSPVTITVRPPVKHRTAGVSTGHRLRGYFYSLMRRYLSLFILPRNSAVEIDPMNDLLVAKLPNGRVTFRTEGCPADSFLDSSCVVNWDGLAFSRPDFLVLSGLIHYERDIQQLLSELHRRCHAGTRLIITYYSSLWRPFIRLTSALGLRDKTSELNWLAPEDIGNLLTLENFELVRQDSKILLPVYIPVLSAFVNRYLAPLPFFRLFTLVNIVVARPLLLSKSRPSVSIVVPARDEAGNINEIIDRIPPMGPHDEIVFVEGHSTDETWSAIQRACERRGHKRTVRRCRQDGVGKGDAVRKGFAFARNPILMILDADMTVPPEELSKFYEAIVSGKGEFINGSRLVYPMDDKAMRFVNLLGNKFFASAFSFVLGQRFKDTLCGTKVISREHYLELEANRSFFGEFDPFGDFDLLFGASRMGLKIVEVPINYRERKYGTTKIARWRHGAILCAMLLFGAHRIRFV